MQLVAYYTSFFVVAFFQFLDKIYTYSSSRCRCDNTIFMFFFCLTKFLFFESLHCTFLLLFYSYYWTVQNLSPYQDWYLNRVINFFPIYFSFCYFTFEKTRVLLCSVHFFFWKKFSHKTKKKIKKKMMVQVGWRHTNPALYKFCCSVVELSTSSYRERRSSETRDREKKKSFD